jgi:hypothetical protein
MDALPALLELLKKNNLIRGNLQGLFHLLIGRRITDPEGATVSKGLTWRELAALLKKLRWDTEAVRELGIDPDTLPPRDRQRFWYMAISHAKIDTTAAREAGDKLAKTLATLGYRVE